MRAGPIAAATVVAVIATLIRPPCVLFVWNTTASMPMGLYVIAPGPVRRGDLSVMRLPPQIEALALAWGILASQIPVLKPVAAADGDRVCRFGPAITINGHLAAIARHVDRNGRDLPMWQGCRRLSASQVFILARHPRSFDSRYFGPVQRHLSQGVAHPLLTFSKLMLFRRDLWFQIRASSEQDKERDVAQLFANLQLDVLVTFLHASVFVLHQSKINSSSEPFRISQTNEDNGGPSHRPWAHTRVALYRAAKQCRATEPRYGSRPCGSRSLPRSLAASITTTMRHAGCLGLFKSPPTPVAPMLVCSPQAGFLATSRMGLVAWFSRPLGHFTPPLRSRAHARQ